MGPNFSLHQPFRNAVLSSLPEGDLQLIRPLLTRLRLVPGQVLIEQGQVTEHVFFMEDGIVSLVAEATNTRTPVQVAMLGHEGLVGCQALLGADTGAFVSSVTLIPGPALRLPVQDLYRLVTHSAALRQAAMAATETLMRQVMQTAASNARNTLAERCIRWLLMAHDRIDGDELSITHELLSNMLGVRRSGITLVVSGLQEAGVVRVNRGRLTILDRQGLERLAGDTAWNVDMVPTASAALPGTNTEAMAPGEATRTLVG